MNRLIGAVANKIIEMGNKYRIMNYQKAIKGMNYRLGDEVYMAYAGNIYIGENTYINGGHIIASKNAKIIIGNNCLISYFVHMRTDMHNYKAKDELIRNQGYKKEDIIIEDDVWIGYGAQIMSGVTIRRGGVIAAGAVVTHSTDEFGVYAGVPAKKIKERELLYDASAKFF